MITRRLFTVTAIAGLLTAPRQWLPDDLLVQARETLPDQWCMVHCLDHLGRRIERMAEMAYLQWVGGEYVVTTPLQFSAPRHCIVAGFAIEPIIEHGEMNTCYMFAGDELNLEITLDVAERPVRS
jgi:hypothetical protein